MTEKITINSGNWIRFEVVGATLKIIILEYGNTKTNSPYIKFTLDEDIKGFQQTKEYQMNIPPWEQKALIKEYGALSEEGKVTGLFEAYRLICTKIDEKNRPTVKLEKWQGHSEEHSNKEERTQHESWDVHDRQKQKSLEDYQAHGADEADMMVTQVRQSEAVMEIVTQIHDFIKCMHSLQVPVDEVSHEYEYILNCLYTQLGIQLYQEVTSDDVS